MATCVSMEPSTLSFRVAAYTGNEVSRFLLKHLFLYLHYLLTIGLQNITYSLGTYWSWGRVMGCISECFKSDPSQISVQIFLPTDQNFHTYQRTYFRNAKHTRSDIAHVKLQVLCPDHRPNDYPIFVSDRVCCLGVSTSEMSSGPKR